MSKLVDLTLEKRHETDLAFLLTEGDKDANDKEIQWWVPKSIVEENGDGTYTMPEWLAIEKGMI